MKLRSPRAPDMPRRWRAAPPKTGFPPFSMSAAETAPSGKPRRRCRAIRSWRSRPVPTGTGNDFIRSFGEKAQKRFCDLAALAAGHIEEIDLLRAAGRISLNIVSCGLDASIAQGVAGLKRIPAVSGAMAYQLSAALCLMTSLHHRYRFLIDGEPRAAQEIIFLPLPRTGGITEADFTRLRFPTCRMA